MTQGGRGRISITQQHSITQQQARRSTPHQLSTTMRLTPLNLRSMYLVNNQRPKNGRRATRVPFPFNGCLPLQLRDSVSGKSEKLQSNPCVQEMFVMFSCFKKNDFDQALCSKEIQTFEACHLNHLTNEKRKKEQERRGVMVPGEKRLAHKQLNHLLGRYKQPV
ncbi:small ribosomal subunit protein mS37-like isoform X1 [Scylla paramamosain]|uniref:small ribosomal subunit protein mS37-like isoform X1 n=2 Tax=Scylla paramamosain TaxID=85552 RepID=UPI0030838797